MKFYGLYDLSDDVLMEKGLGSLVRVKERRDLYANPKSVLVIQYDSPKYVLVQTFPSETQKISDAKIEAIKKELKKYNTVDRQ